MVQKEIIKKLEEGKQLIKTFGVKTDWYTIGEDRITSKQFDAVLSLYKDKLDFNGIYGGFTKHIYTIKAIK